MSDRIRRETELLPQLHGQECARAYSNFAGILALNFGTLHPFVTQGRDGPRDTLKADYTLFIQCAWRLESPAQMLVGMYDSDEHINQRTRVLVGSRVRATRVEPPGYTTKITFDNDHSIWLFPCEAVDFLPDEDVEYPRTPWFVIGVKVADVGSK
ncbi:MAG TPA: hypothetical protein VMM78_02190 [Thermomicrobiales bacterium]|nr:hypothetical protein [Thermomicrobiales bacterium]